MSMQNYYKGPQYQPERIPVDRAVRPYVVARSNITIALTVDALDALCLYAAGTPMTPEQAAAYIVEDALKRM